MSYWHILLSNVLFISIQSMHSWNTIYSDVAEDLFNILTYFAQIWRCPPDQSSLILMRLVPPQWPFELPGELWSRISPDLSSRSMGVFLIKDMFRVESKQGDAAGAGILYCETIVKPCVCKSRYGWLWNVGGLHVIKVICILSCTHFCIHLWIIYLTCSTKGK